MARYSLNLPADLKQEAERWAAAQGVSLNQFILWAVAERVGALSQRLDDPRYSRITYRRGVAGSPVPVVRETGVRIQTLVTASQAWGLATAEIANEYGLTLADVEEALRFYEDHRTEIDQAMAAEENAEQPTRMVSA